MPASTAQLALSCVVLMSQTSKVITAVGRTRKAKSDQLRSADPASKFYEI